MMYFELIDFEFLILFSIICLINIMIVNYRFTIANYFKIIDVPNERKIHKDHTFNWRYRYFLTILIVLIYFFLNQLNMKTYLLISICTIFF